MTEFKITAGYERSNLDQRVSPNTQYWLKQGVQKILFVTCCHGWQNLFQSGGHKCTSKNYRKLLRFELATVTLQALKYDVITYTPIWRSKLHYFRQNYTTMETYRWTTWNTNKLLQGRPRSSASLGLIIRFIL